MFEKLKRCLVENYIGAIALGRLLGEGILRFTSIFTAPVAGWIARSEFRDIPLMPRASQGLLLRDAGERLFETVVILLVWYLLMRWLYFNPFEKESGETITKKE